jgi:autotransporter-associated beta strand protein
MRIALCLVAFAVGCAAGPDPGTTGTPDGGFVPIPDVPTAPQCRGNRDSVIARSEVAFAPGLEVRYRVNPVGTLAIVSPRGTPRPDGTTHELRVVVQTAPSPAPRPAASLVWQGGQNGDAWDAALSGNWLNAAATDTFRTGDSVSFTAAGSAHPIVNLVAGLAPAAVTVDATSDYTFSGSGAITGGTGLTKSGSGNLTLSTANSYTGDTIVNGGTLTLGVAAAIPGSPSSGQVTLNGGTVDLNGFSTTFNDFSGAGVVDSTTGTAPVLTLANVNDSTFSGGFQDTAGSLSVVKGGAGILTLSGNSTHSGGTFIGINNNGTRIGTLRAASSQALGSGPLTIGLGGNDASATLELAGGITLANAVELPGRTNASPAVGNVSGNNSLTGALTLTIGGTEFTIESAAGLLTLGSTGNPLIAAIPNSATRNLNLGGAGNGLIAGDLNLTNGALNMQINKSGTGTWTIAGALVFTGNTTVTGGVLAVAADDVFGDTSTVTLASNASLNLTHGGTDQVGTLVINGVTQSNGTYTFGTGKLKVGISTPFEDWALLKGLDGTPGKEDGPTDDPDGDGAANLIEFAFNGDPRNGADNGRIHHFTADSSDVPAGKDLVLTIAVRSGAPAFSGSPSPTSPIDGITYSVQGSTNLAAFTSGVSAVDPVVDGLDPAGAGYEYRSFILDGSDTLSGKGFLRATVIEAP